MGFRWFNCLVVLEGEAGGEDEGICNRRRRGSGQRQHHQRAYVKGTARASGIADAAQATRSASAKGAQRWAFQLKGFANKVQNTSSTSAGVCNLHGLGGRWEVCS